MRKLQTSNRLQWPEEAAAVALDGRHGRTQPASEDLSSKAAEETIDSPAEMVVPSSRTLIGHDPVAEAAAWRNEPPREDDPPSGDLPRIQPRRPDPSGPKGANLAIATLNPIPNPREIKDLGVCVTDYGYRYFHPELGRWISRDPIGEEGGINFYAFSINNAINKIDRLGLILAEPENGDTKVISIVACRCTQVITVCKMDDSIVSLNYDGTGSAIFEPFDWDTNNPESLQLMEKSLLSARKKALDEAGQKALDNAIANIPRPLKSIIDQKLACDCNLFYDEQEFKDGKWVPTGLGELGPSVDQFLYQLRSQMIDLHKPMDKKI